MLEHLNLLGDGDEVDAIEEVEREFGVRIDTGDAPNWVRVGDVYASLQRALPDYLRRRPSTWPRFCWALCQVTCDDPALVDEATAMLIPRRASLFDRFRR
jgi:hypothetical protein